MFKTLLYLTAALSISAHAAPDFQGSTDTDLKITVQELHGVKATTKNNLYVKVIFERAGKSFSVFCTRQGKVRLEGSTNAIYCVDYAQTVSHDDDESFEFSVTEQTNSEGETSLAVEQIGYGGDGTFLAEKVQTLSGMSWNDRRRENLVIGLRPLHARSLPAFEKTQTVLKALRPLVAMSMPIRAGRHDLEVPIKEFSFDIQNDGELNISASLDGSAFKAIQIKDPEALTTSIYKTPGQLSSGFRNTTTLKTQVRQTWNLR